MINLFLIIAFIFIGMSLMRVQKDSIADLLTKTIRNDLISGDYREARIQINLINDGHFKEVAYYRGEKRIFHEEEEKNILFNGEIKKTIWMAEKKEEAYFITFKYSYLKALFFSLGVWFFVFLSGLSLLIKEKKKMIKEKADEIKREKEITTLSIAGQVIHDIRSPLASLNEVLMNCEGIPKKEIQIIDNVIKRIHGIANSLLQQNKDLFLHDQRHIQKKHLDLKLIDLRDVIDILIEEKESSFAGKVLLEKKYYSGDKLFIKGDENLLSRCISNILNNSIDALEKGGNIWIEIWPDPIHENLTLKVQDNGKGIPSHVLERIGESGFSFGKEVGTGLGVYSAKKTIENIGGKLVLHSIESVGTTVSISLPISRKPQYILIDDDELIQMTWRLAAERNNVSLSIFSTYEEFFKDHLVFSKKVVLYIDLRLKENVSGLDVAEKIHNLGFENIYIETGAEEVSLDKKEYIKGVCGKEPPWETHHT